MVNSALQTQQLSAMSSGTQSDASTVEAEEPMIPFTDGALLAETTAKENRKRRGERAAQSIAMSRQPSSYDNKAVQNNYSSTTVD